MKIWIATAIHIRLVAGVTGLPAFGGKSEPLFQTI